MRPVWCAALAAGVLAGCGGGGGGGGVVPTPPPTVAPAAQPQDPVQPAETPVVATTITIGDTFTPTAMGNFTGSSLGDFDYQSYGVWARGSGDDVLTRATSTGTATPGNSIPTTGTATYTGTAKGFYWVNGNAQRWLTTANMTAGVDFERREVAFSTSNMAIIGGPPPGPNFDLFGTLRYGPGNNDIRGTVTTGDTSMSGNAQARFYGPQAQEIGGVYRVERGSSGMTGAFGGKR
jgi:hypothetical protein